MSFKLLVEKTDPESFEYIISEANKDSRRTMYIKGPYMMAGEVNKNDRVYPVDEMVKEVDRYNTEFVDANRAMGELNHPASAEVDLERACHLVTRITQDRNVFIGESKILSTPMGKIVENLIVDGVKVGMSSRALGKLTPMDTGGKTVNEVSDMKLIAIDCVVDPSYPDAFVNGILESKNWILNQYGQYEESFGQFENSLANLPKSDVESYIKEQIMIFINKLK